MVIYCKLSSTLMSEHLLISHVLTFKICLRWGHIPISSLVMISVEQMKTQEQEKTLDSERQLISWLPLCHLYSGWILLYILPSVSCSSSPSDQLFLSCKIEYVNMRE